ncbi:DUF1330 domain-containing protein [Novosphingobium sp.]|uniref:DUF1330 domain-containing protein n=1 Tax=Novosphingobium sp. TaxID=1874826 RepID=UPI00260FBB11|nr:DUF1330 domain-containing protein [Novosphingobium sp.]
MIRHLEPTNQSAMALFGRRIAGPVTMLNLLRFRAVADYAAHPDLAPATPISGAEAFDRYVAATLPHLQASGGALLFMGAGGPCFIGPEDERWDRVMLVKQASVEAFIAFATNETYRRDAIGHRTAALEDARLVPLEDLPVSPA